MISNTPKPLKWFLAWRARDHYNFAYGRMGELKGSYLTCQNMTAVPIDGSPLKVVANGEKVKVKWVPAAVLEVALCPGDLVWTADNLHQYHAALNMPWTMAGLIAQTRIYLKNDADVPGEWFIFKERVGLEPTQAPTVDKSGRLSDMNLSAVKRKIFIHQPVLKPTAKIGRPRLLTAR